eukprot:365081-Chlamydomonas_euryale.AAC.1
MPPDNPHPGHLTGVRRNGAGSVAQQRVSGTATGAAPPVRMCTQRQGEWCSLTSMHVQAERPCDQQSPTGTKVQAERPCDRPSPTGTKVQAERPWDRQSPTGTKVQAER